MALCAQQFEKALCHEEGPLDVHLEVVPPVCGRDADQRAGWGEDSRVIDEYIRVSNLSFYLSEQLLHRRHVRQVRGDCQDLRFWSERLDRSLGCLELRDVAPDEDDGFGLGFCEGGSEPRGTDAGGGAGDDDCFGGEGEGRGGRVDAGVLVAVDVWGVGVGGGEVVGGEVVHLLEWSGGWMEIGLRWRSVGLGRTFTGDIDMLGRMRS